MQITGTLKHITGVVKNDKGYESQSIHLGIDETTQYPQVLKIELGKSLLGKFNLPIGSTVTCDINLRGKEYTNKAGALDCFSSIQAWKISANSQGASQAVTSGAVAEGSTSPNADPSGLPFWCE